MHSKQHLRWLEKNNLLEVAKSNSKHFVKVLKHCLNVNHEDVLIIGDQGYENKHIAALMAAGYYLASRELGLTCNLIIQPPKERGGEADDAVVKALEDLKEGSVLVFTLSSRLGGIKLLGKSYRKFALSRGHRFISTPSLGNIETLVYPKVIDSINIDYNQLRERCSKVKQALDMGEELHITTAVGTDLYYGIKGMVARPNDADYREPGTGGNIPAGEVYLAPSNKTKVNGKVVIDSTMSFKEKTRLIKNPVTLTIKNDKLINIEGGKEAELFEETLAWAESQAKFPWGIRRLGEFGIGLNPKATPLGATIVDEKCLNTAHIAFGSNYWFGGKIYAIVHLDQVFKNPKIEVDGKILRY